MDGQGTTWHRNIAENFNRLSRVHQRYRRQTYDRQTDGPSMTYSERELEFTFANHRTLTYSSSDTTVGLDIATVVVSTATREHSKQENAKRLPLPPLCNDGEVGVAVDG